MGRWRRGGRPGFGKAGSGLRACGVAALLTLLPAAAGAAPAIGDCGTVVTQANNDITSFSPLYADNLGNSRAAQLLFQPLLWVNRYGQVDAARSLVSRIDISRDTTRYTLTLRGWHWSDGLPVTADDVVYDWRMIEQLGVSYPGYGSGGIPQQIRSVTALDASHVQIRLRQPANPLWFIDNGLSQFVPLPAHAWAKLPPGRLFQTQSAPGFFTVIDGPMRVQRLDIGLDAVFVPNPRYDGPPAHLHRLVLVFEHSDGAAVQQVEAGDLDFAPVPMEFYAAVQHLPGLHLALLSPVSYWYYLALNLQNPAVAFFRDVRVRQAIQDAIDQQQVVQLVFHGFGHPVYTPIPPVDARMLAPGLTEGGDTVGYDPAKSRALLTAAGFAAGADGMFSSHGRPLAFTAMIAGDSAEETAMVVMIQAQLRAAGIDMRLRQVAFNQMLQEMQGAAGWQAAQLGTVSNPYPSGEGMFATGASENNGGYSDPVMDRLIEASIAKPGIAGLYDYEIYAAAQQPVIFLATEDHLDLVSNRIHGVDAFSDGAMLAPDALYCSTGAAGT